MNKESFQKEITTSELATMMMAGFERLENKFTTQLNTQTEGLRKEMKEGFAKTNESFNERFNQLDNAFDRRMSVTEDRVRVIKNVIEKDLGARVAW